MALRAESVAKKRERRKSEMRIHQTIAQELGIAILTGFYRPGDHMPGEIEQAATLGVSRTAYREAIRILIAKGLMESKPKSGTHVTARDRWNLLDPDMLAWMFMGEPDEQFIHDLFELRNLLEPKAAELAAQRRSADQLESMRDAIEGMRLYGLATSEGRAADQKFHSVLLAATGNAAMATLASSIGAAVQWTTDFKQRASSHARDSLSEHVAVFAAIEAGNAEAARSTMTTLIQRAFEDMAFAL